jgi:hypothetical protein
MLGPGDRLPDARVWTNPQESATLREIAGGRPLLLLFFLFDWSTT